MGKRVKKYIKSASCLMFSVAFAVSGVSCKKNDPQTESETGYTLWSAPTTEKILQDVDMAEYEAVSTEAQLSVDTAKNEYESAQVLITANTAVQNYTVSVSDLVCEENDSVYSKDNISVFNMKYCNMTSSWNEGTRVGWYPDAILPFEKAVEAQENKVSEGKNQSVYFSFNTPDTQATGVYTGTVTLTVDGEENEIPVSVRVRNVTVNEEVHNKSFFLTHWYTYLGEYDSTQATLDKYTKALFEYRLAPATLVVDTAYKQEDADFYAEKAYELCANEKCSTIGIPTNKSSSGIAKGVMTMYIKALALKSIETDYDLISKCYVYGIDEPIQNGALEKTKAFAATFYSQRDEAKEYFLNNKDEILANNPFCSAQFYDELVEAIDNIRFITTTKWAEEYVDYVDIWCPHFNTFESGEATGLYDNEDKMWFYGCLTPKAPYPTYHVDDTLLSARMVGWLQSIYNVEGNLYWAVNNFARYESDSGYSYLDEYYDNPNHFNYVPGEGFLFYPGKKYNVDGPIASIRLEAIRDGYEEYELFYNLQKQYENTSQQIGVPFSANNTIEALASGLYTGMKVTADTQSFASAREQLLSLAEFSQSGVCFTDYVDNGEGNIQYSVYIPDGVNVEVAGLTKQAEQSVSGGKILTYVADMTKEGAASIAEFSTSVNGETVSVQFKLSGKVVKVEGEKLQGLFTGSVVEEETVLVDASSVNGESGKLLQISLTAATESARARITISNEDVIKAFDKTTDKAVFNWYYAGTDDLKLNVYVKQKQSTYPRELGAQITLKTGANTVSLEGISTINWEKNGDIEYIFFEIGELNQPARNDLYLKNIVVYKMQEETE